MRQCRVQKDVLQRDRHAEVVSSLALRSLVLWRAWDVTPMPKRHFVRFLTDYQRHCLYRPLNLDRVDLGRSPALAGERRS